MQVEEIEIMPQTTVTDLCGEPCGNLYVYMKTKKSIYISTHFLLTVWENHPIQRNCLAVVTTLDKLFSDASWC